MLNGDRIMSTIVKWKQVEFEIVYEDPDLLIVDKPVGLCVQPGSGNLSGTLQDILSSKQSNPFVELPRFGIVHRLDKNTSGLMVIAKTIESYEFLVYELRKRRIKREYLAVVEGCPTVGKSIKSNIGRDPINRVKMSVQRTGKEAVTHFSILERYRKSSLIYCRLETGRTHQIRVHMAHIGSPLFGDHIYNNNNLKNFQSCQAGLVSFLKNFNRQALHAYRLAFIHPTTKEPVEFIKYPPRDIKMLIKFLREDAELSGMDRKNIIVNNLVSAENISFHSYPKILL